MTIEDQARARWAALMGGGGAQDRSPGAPAQADLPAPTHVTAEQGHGQVTVRWSPVPHAIGYAVHRAATPTGHLTVVDHGGGDVLAVPHAPYADTTDTRGGWYAVAALQTVDAVGPLSDPVPVTTHPAEGVDGAALGSRTVPPDTVHAAAPADLADDVAGEPRTGSVESGHAPSGPRGTAGTPVVTAVVGAQEAPLHRVWQEMVGSEHLSHLLQRDTTGGRPIGAELREALRRVHDELGVRSVRAHAILGDDLGVYRDVDGRAVHDFERVCEVYDIVRELGMVPVVELGYMPRDLAADPSRTVFAYQGIISPPRDWDRWSDLVRAFTAHLAGRYGLDELRDRWRFEVWNEPNPSTSSPPTCTGHCRWTCAPGPAAGRSCGPSGV